MALRKGPGEDEYVRKFREALVEKYLPVHARARVDAKRYNSDSVRVRVLDPDFAHKAMVKRDDAVWEVLDTLPDDTRREISTLILLTPKVAKTSLMNVEFEDPMPSPF
jgi:hypothetical protein